MKARSRRVDGIKYSFNFNDYVVFFFVYTTTPVKHLLVSLYNHAGAICG